MNSSQNQARNFLEDKAGFCQIPLVQIGLSWGASDFAVIKPTRQDFVLTRIRTENRFGFCWTHPRNAACDQARRPLEMIDKPLPISKRIHNSKNG